MRAAAFVVFLMAMVVVPLSLSAEEKWQTKPGSEEEDLEKHFYDAPSAVFDFTKEKKWKGADGQTAYAYAPFKEKEKEEKKSATDCGWLCTATGTYAVAGSVIGTTFLILDQAGVFVADKYTFSPTGEKIPLTDSGSVQRTEATTVGWVLVGTAVASGVTWAILHIVYDDD